MSIEVGHVFRADDRRAAWRPLFGTGTVPGTVGTVPLWDCNGSASFHLAQSSDSAYHSGTETVLVRAISERARTSFLDILLHFFDESMGEGGRKK